MGRIRHSAKGPGNAQSGFVGSPCDPTQALETLADNANAEVPALARAGVTGMNVAVVFDVHLGRRESGSEACLERADHRPAGAGGCDRLGHRRLAGPSTGNAGPVTGLAATGSIWRIKKKPWINMKTSIRPLVPKTLNVAHVEVE